MIINFKVKNIVAFKNIEIDFLIHSKKSGEYIKDNDYIKIKNLKIQKKIGLIGSNSSGKTLTLKLFTLFSNFFYIGNLYKLFYDSNLFALTNKKIFKNINNKENNQKNPWTANDVKVDKNELFEMIKKSYENFISSNSFDSNKNEIEFEIKFVYKNEIIVGNYLIDKNGNIKYFFRKKEKIVYENQINFFSLNPFSNIKLTYENWELNLLYVPFETKFDFGILNPTDFPTSSNNFAILNNIFDYTRNNGKVSHFLKWLKIADYSTKNLISDVKKKIFNVQKEDGEIIVIDNLSLGTKKWLILYFFLFVAIKKSDEVTNIIVYDEIENSFHNKLVLSLFDIFDEKIENCQLIFSSHNPEIFDKTFKHDGIYLSAQDKGLCSLTRLDEFKLKKDINFRSFYLNEKIGKHPDDQNILDFCNGN